MSTYCVRTDIDKIYGSGNIDDWADLNNNDNAGEIAAVVTARIAEASADIDSKLRRTHYRIPLVTAAGATPTEIVSLCAEMAGILIHDLRGVVDEDEGAVAEHRKRTRQFITDVQSGDRRIDAL